MTLDTLALLVLSALFGDHDRTDRMVVRAGCPSTPMLAAAIDLHTENDRERSTLAALFRTEGLCNVRAVGDHGTSFGAFQIHGREWSWLVGDLDAQVSTALGMVRASVRRCGRGDAELAEYTRGRCDSERGRELSAVRVRLARFARGAR